MDFDHEKRASQRIQVEVPVKVGHQKAITRDISWTGVYFWAEQAIPVGEAVNFSLDLNYALPGEPFRLECRGEVLRVEQQGNLYGIAAQIHNFQSVH